MLTPKENLLEVIHGGKPEYVPVASEAIQFVGMIPANILECSVAPGVDAFGIPWVPGKEGVMVKPGFQMFDDVCDWREYVKAPDLDKIDWEGFAKAELADVDRTQKLTSLFCTSGIFIRMANLMGFEDCLISLAMEPEECKALFDYLSDYVVDYLTRAIDAYRPDMVTYFEDIATSNSLFMSLETYRELLKPYHQKIVNCVTSRGVLFQMHTCGKCEAAIDDYVDMGVRLWHSAQPENDIAGLLEKYQGKFIIEGGWDSQGAVSHIGSSVEECIAETHRCMKEYGSKPGFIFSPILINERGNSLFVGDERLDAVLEEWKKINKLS